MIPLVLSRCAEGFMGQRCEFKDLDGSYLRKCVCYLPTFTGSRLIENRFVSAAEKKARRSLSERKFKKKRKRISGPVASVVNVHGSQSWSELAKTSFGLSEMARCDWRLTFPFTVTASRQRVLLETASIAGGATIAVFLVVIVCITLYLHYQRKTKERKLADIDRTDGPGRDLERRPFSRCLSIPMDRLGEVSRCRRPMCRTPPPPTASTEKEKFPFY